MNCQSDIFHIVLAVRPPRRLSSRLQSGQEQADKESDDGNDNKQLHESEAEVGSARYALSPKAMHRFPPDQWLPSKVTILMNRDCVIKPLRHA